MPALLLGRGTLRGGASQGASEAPITLIAVVMVPSDFQGVIETDAGAEVLFDYRGYGRAYPVGRRQIAVSATHLSEDERYRWLNDSLSVGVGEVRSQEDGPTELVIEWAEMVWEPVSE